MQINRRTLLWGVIAILFIVTLFVVFKATGNGGAAVSSTGQAVSAAQSASNAMVGGC